jgi:outer membrane protein assembly factor BamB
MNKYSRIAFRPERSQPLRLIAGIILGFLGFAGGGPEAVQAAAIGLSHATGATSTNIIGLWKLTVDAAVHASPVIGADGTVYFASYNGTVFAVEPQTGDIRWTHQFSGESSLDGSPALGPNGVLYIGGNDNQVHALNASNGEVKWSYNMGGPYPVISTPSIGTNGLVYVGGRNNNVLALAADTGLKKWEFKTAGEVWSSASFSRDGSMIYIGSHDRKMYALDAASGVKRWQYATGGIIYATPTVDEDGTVFFGSDNGILYALNGTNGVRKWMASLGGTIWSSVLLPPGDLAIVGGASIVRAGDYHVFGLNKNTGSIRWRTPSLTVGLGYFATPALSADGTLYAGVDGNRIYAFNAADGAVKWQYQTTAPVYSSPAIGPDGTFYVGCDDTNFYAFKAAGGGPAASTWPKFKANAMNDGYRAPGARQYSFTEWAQTEIAEDSQRNPADDPDHDGLSNAVEYATGGQPTQPCDLHVCKAVLDTSTVSQGYLVIAYPEAKNVQGVRFVVETTSGLPASWAPLHPQMAEETPEDKGTYVLKRFRIPLSAASPAIFVRLTVAFE